MNKNHKLSFKTYGDPHTRLHRPKEVATKKLGKGRTICKSDYANSGVWHMPILYKI